MTVMARWFASGENPSYSWDPEQAWDLILWSQNGKLRATRCNAGLPETMLFNGRVYQKLETRDDPFWSALRNSENQVTGFEIHFVTDPLILESQLITDTGGVMCSRCLDKHHSIELLFQEGTPYEYMGTERFPVLFFRDDSGDLVIWFGSLDAWIGAPTELGLDLSPLP
jgi:hypothetical protein